MTCLIHPTFYPNIAHFTAIVNADVVCFEVCGNYQKQSLRNRTEIYGANGKLALTAPVSYTQKNRQLYKDVKIANENNWQQQHLKSLESAYRMSPFFEYYIDDLMPFELLINSLQLTIKTSKTIVFEKEPTNKTDLRHLVNRNFESSLLQPYTQVFTEKHGYIPNLSILDLLFNEGPNTPLYLKDQSL